MSSADKMDSIFKALASPVRRELLDCLKDDPQTTGALCERFPVIDRCTVMQHLKVLERADLIIVQRKGRERWNHINPLPIRHIQERWIGPHADHAVTVLDRLTSDLEGSS
ncbi:ArsR/SmtB family transcription factor [Glycocaulis sp.]|uniref:ArsR/SmtB family transcription factor n=1 Tax=Glycocaulis sp. TaxID=1969725 RepID=UPI003F70A537